MSLLILYGTETGTAQDVAESVRREAMLRRIRARVVSFYEYEIENLAKERIVVFVVATTGQGEIPPNMLEAWKWLLRRAIPRDWLRNVGFPEVVFKPIFRSMTTFFSQFELSS